MQQQSPFSPNDFPMVHPLTFKQNPLIRKLASEENWTLSDIQKRPINARAYLVSGMIYNAKFDGENPLVTLDELDNDPNLQAVNRAYRLKARENRVIAVDIEPEAPEMMKLQALNMPAHYTELSTNGGVHLLIQVPEDIITDENRYMFDDLAVMKEPVPKDPVTDKQERGAYFEVIFNDHFITFTKRMLTTKPCVDYNQDPQAKSQLKAFIDNITLLDRKRKEERELAKKFRIQMIEGMVDDEKRAHIERFINMKPFEQVRRQASEKDVSDFGGDDSRYEMSVAGSIAFHVIRIHKLAKDTLSFQDMANALTEQDLVYSIYLILKDVIPYRDKHDEDREGLSWLLFTAKKAYEYIKAQNAKRRKN